MNRALAETLTVLNGLIAVVIVAAGLIAGYRIYGGSIVGTLAGGFAGFLIASLACGALAYLALIERHLARIANTRPDNIQVRRDPRL